MGILTASAMMYVKMKTVDLGGLEDRYVRLVSHRQGPRVVRLGAFFSRIQCILL